MHSTNKLIDGLVEVLTEIVQDYDSEKKSRSKLSDCADTLRSNQVSSSAFAGIKELKSDLLKSMNSFAIHDFDNSTSPELSDGARFHSETQIADTLKFPKNIQNDLTIKKFTKKNSNASTLIVNCSNINTKAEKEKLVRKNCKTSANLPKYVHNFVTKIRPL